MPTSALNCNASPAVDVIIALISALAWLTNFMVLHISLPIEYPYNHIFSNISGSKYWWQRRKYRTARAALRAKTAPAPNLYLGRCGLYYQAVAPFCDRGAICYFSNQGESDQRAVRRWWEKNLAKEEKLERPPARPLVHFSCRKRSLLASDYNKSPSHEYLKTKHCT